MTSSGDLNIRILKQYIDIKVNVNKEIKVLNLQNESIIRNKIIEHLKHLKGRYSVVVSVDGFGERGPQIESCDSTMKLY